MIAERTNRRLWRLCAIAVFCGLPLLLGGLAISSLVNAKQALDLAERRHVATALIVAKLEKHRVSVTPIDIASFYLQSASATLARAEIQDRAEKLASRAGGRIVEMQLTATPEQEAAGSVAIQLSLDIDNKGLLDLLYASESGLPLLDVTDLSVQILSDRADKGSGDLHVDMTVRGHWRKTTG